MEFNFSLFILHTYDVWYYCLSVCVCVCRLRNMIAEVYSERGRLRKHMADLDAWEREALLKVCRKVSILGREGEDV